MSAMRTGGGSATSTSARVGRSSAFRFDAVSLLTVYAALLVVLPARLVLPALGAAGRPALLFAVGLLFLWLFTRALPEQVLPGAQPLRWALALFTVAFLVSYALGFARGLPGLESRGADRALLTMAGLIGVALVAADGIRSTARLDTLLRRLVALTSVSAFVGVVQFFFRLDLASYVQVPGLALNRPIVGIGERGGPGFARVAGLTGHYIEFGVVLAMVLPIALHLLLFARSRREKQLWASAVALLAASVPLSVSRAGSLALMVGMVLLVVGWTTRLRALAAVIGGVGVVVFQGLIPGLLGTIRSGFVNYENDPSILGRLGDYEVVAEYFTQRPWFGRGPGTFLPELYLLLDNQYLATAIELGAVGGASLVLVVLVGIVMARVGRRISSSERQRHLMHALSVVLVQALVVSFTFDSLSFATFAGLLFLALGLVGAAHRLRGEEEDPEGAHVVLRTIVSARTVPAARRRPEPPGMTESLVRAWGRYDHAVSTPAKATRQ